MDKAVFDQLSRELREDEAVRRFPYDDATSKPPVLLIRTTAGAFARSLGDLVIGPTWELLDSKTKQRPILAARNREGQFVEATSKITIGIGWNLTDNGFPVAVRQGLLELGIGPGLNLSRQGITDAAISHLLQLSIFDAERVAERIFPELRSYSARRQIALISLAFNLGFSRLLKFRETIRLMRAGKWDAAADRLLTLPWARQVKAKRAKRIADHLRDR